MRHDTFTILHNRLYTKVYSFVRLRIKDKEEARDIVQDVFLKAFNSWKDKDDNEILDENTARNYLYLIAKQRMIDLWRSGRSRFQTDLYSEKDDNGQDDIFDSLASDGPLPEEIFEKNERRDSVLKLLNRLKEDEREILILRFLEELEYKELAKIYQTSEGNVRQKVSRSLQNLKSFAAKAMKDKEGRNIN